MTSSAEHSVRVTFDLEGAKEELREVSFNGEEGLSRLFRFELILAARSSELPLEKLMGSNGLITIITDEGTRYIQGQICEMEQREIGRTHTYYSAILVPAAWRLTRRRGCRIFQRKTALKIVEDILGPAKVAFKIRTRANQTPPERDYCVQYRESDWDFICRLLEEEGYCFYFEHGPDRHVLQISNDTTMASPVAGGGLRYVRPDSEMPGAEHIFQLFLRAQLDSGKVSTTDYNFENPTLDLLAEQQAERDADLEVYDYPGLHREQTRGKELNKVRLEALRARTALLSGQSSAPRLCSGYSFKLDGHGRTSLNGKHYLICSVQHHARKESGDLEAGGLDERCSYDNSFECIPRKVPFRPGRITPRPVVKGVQTAVVVGPSNEEIYTDKHGRVKVRFHWDRRRTRDQDSSCWIRVSQQWAGQGWGSLHLPRIGQEVIVDFLEGNPDRPIITGRVYHAQNPPPYLLPAEKTKSTIKSDSSPGGGGSNEIRFEDASGSEEIYVHAEKDQNERVENDLSTDVGRDLSQMVSRNRRMTVGSDETNSVGNDRTEKVGRNESITIGVDRSEAVGGDETVKVSGKRTVSVGANQKVTVRKDATLAVRKNATEKVGLRRRLTIGSSSSTTVGGRMDLTVNDDLVSKVAGAVSEQAGTSRTIRVGTKLEIVCGESRLVMEKDGRITLEGKEFRINAAGPVRVKGNAMQLRGKSLSVKTSGPIKLKGTKISEN